MALSYPSSLERLPPEDRRLLARAVEANQNAPAAAVAPLGRIGEVAHIPWNERTMDASGEPAQEPEALAYPVRFPEVEWEWPASFQDEGPRKAATAADINWIAPA